MQQGGRFQVGIVVQDLAPMVDFYEGLLGFEHIEDLEMPNGLMKRFVFGDSGLKLLALDEPRATAGTPGGPTGGISGIRYLTIEVPDVSALVEKCVATGRAVPMPVFEYAPGMPVAMVEDPEGNWVELIQPAPNG
jgi:catechol 2,3-dioxygenase-like lactoylglutathione lyase family enzyme